ncbi:PREDICTED: aluminum-activated malate transporter 2-like [Theobroma cacao]|uniref:Aluminum-activated malate transporter 2-like n=1 Tax=Theobroma cacao TaxID=3641 RepID=A0AB32WXF9_THECC|nr:PREDICTED: aluminum-activated malate transporter 2-like [Theobroma cacao]
MSSPAHEINPGPFSYGRQWLKALLPSKTLNNRVVELARKAKNLGKDDPRKVVHSLKVALALTLVSLFYYFKPLCNGFGVNAIWAVLTVIFVLEFSVGATLGKGLNRMLATLLAAALGIGAHNLAIIFGKTGEPILLSFLVSVVGASFTFLRFLPEMKVKYDFGLMVFILTFCLISILSYREELLIIALQRLLTIVVGSCAAIFVSIIIFPVCIGEDLHNLVAVNLEKLGTFLEGFGAEYFSVPQEGVSIQEKLFPRRYKSVLTSQESEENMASLATWEPRHGRFRFRHPWKQHRKVGDLTRECAYKIEALNSYPFEIRSRIQEPCTMISLETGKALKDLASAMQEMVQSTSVDSHISNSKIAAENLKALIKSGLWEGVELLETIPATAVVSVLLDLVVCTEKIAEVVHQLASLAHFKSNMTAERSQSIGRSTIRPMSSIDPRENHVINIVE